MTVCSGHLSAIIGYCADAAVPWRLTNVRSRLVQAFWLAVALSCPTAWTQERPTDVRNLDFKDFDYPWGASEWLARSLAVDELAAQAAGPLGSWAVG